MFACTQIYPKVMVAFVLVLTSFGLLLIPYFQHVLIDSRPTKKIIPFVAVATNMFEFFLKTLVTVHNTLRLLLLFLWLKPSRFGFEFYFLFFWFLKYAKHSSRNQIEISTWIFLPFELDLMSWSWTFWRRFFSIRSLLHSFGITNGISISNAI